MIHNNESTKNIKHTALVTGAAGFIGFHLSKALLDQGQKVIGIDNLNDYYDPKLKLARLELLESHKNFSFHKIDIADHQALRQLFDSTQANPIIPERIYHMAAQAGVRYSITNPFAYSHSNLTGFLSILELARHLKTPHLIYASSSSVYGDNPDTPFKVTHDTEHPVSLYAATKKSNELMAHTYSHLYNVKSTGLRFFTVYGPWGRPDMAYYTFTKKILNNEPITLFNHGKHQRDFTYIDDIVDGIVRIGEKLPDWGHRIFNIGNSKPVWLSEFISTLESHLGKKAITNNAEKAQGDVLNTWADVDDLKKECGFEPQTSLKDGLGHFVKWYLSYHKPN